MSLDEIHAENLRRLAAMDMEEVAAAQQEILSMLSPEAIEMLRSSQASSGALLPPPQKARRGAAEEEKRRASEEARRAELLTRRIDSEEALARAARELLSEEEREPIDWFNTPPAARTQEEGGAEAVIRLDLEGRVIEAARAGDILAHSGLYHNPEQVREDESGGVVARVERVARAEGRWIWVGGPALSWSVRCCYAVVSVQQHVDVQLAWIVCLCLLSVCPVCRLHAAAAV